MAAQRHVVRQALIKVVEIDTPLKVSDVAVASTYCSVSVVYQSGSNPITGEPENSCWVEVKAPGSSTNAVVPITRASSVIDGIEIGQETILFLKPKPNEKWRAFGFQGRPMALEWLNLIRSAKKNELEQFLTPISPPASARPGAAVSAPQIDASAPRPFHHDEGVSNGPTTDGPDSHKFLSSPARPVGVSALNLNNVTRAYGNNRMYDSNQTLPLSSPQTLERKQQQYGSTGTIVMERNPLESTASPLEVPLESVATDFMPQSSPRSPTHNNNGDLSPHKKIYKSEKDAFKAAERLKIDITQRISQTERDLMLQQNSKDGIYDGNMMNQIGYGQMPRSLPELSQLQSLQGVRAVPEESVTPRYDPENPSTVILQRGIPYDLPVVEPHSGASPCVQQEAVLKLQCEISALRKQVDMEQNYSKILEENLKKQQSENASLSTISQANSAQQANSLSSLAKENETLRSENATACDHTAQLEKRNNNLVAENEFILQEMENAKDVILKMDKTNTQVRRDNEQLTQDNSNLQMKNEQLTQDNSNLLRENDQLSRSNSNMQRELEQLSRERDAALQNTEKEVERDHTIHQLEMERNELMKDRNAAKAEKDRFGAEYRKARKELTELQDMLKEVDQKFQESNAKLAQRNSQYRELSDEKKSVLTTIDSLVQMFVKLNSKWDSDYISAMGNHPEQERMIATAAEDRKRMCQAMAQEAMLLGKAIHERVSSSATDILSPGLLGGNLISSSGGNLQAAIVSHGTEGPKPSQVRNQILKMEAAVRDAVRDACSQMDMTAKKTPDNAKNMPGVTRSGGPLTPTLRPSLSASPGFVKIPAMMSALSPAIAGVPPLVVRPQSAQELQQQPQCEQSRRDTLQFVNRAEQQNTQSEPQGQFRSQTLEKQQPQDQQAQQNQTQEKQQRQPADYICPSKVNMTREESVAELVERFGSPKPTSAAQLRSSPGGTIYKPISLPGQNHLCQNNNNSWQTPQPRRSLLGNSPRLKTQLVVFPPRPHVVAEAPRSMSDNSIPNSVAQSTRSQTRDPQQTPQQTPQQNRQPVQTPKLLTPQLMQRGMIYQPTQPMSGRTTPDNPTFAGMRFPMVGGLGDRLSPSLGPMRHMSFPRGDTSVQ